MEGLDLSEMMWVVSEMGKPEEKALKVIVHGSFQTGFTQIAEIPPEWARKATQVRAGTNFLLRQEQNDAPH